MATKKFMVEFTVPSEVDPEELLLVMGEEFFYALRNDEQWGKTMEHIETRIVEVQS